MHPDEGQFPRELPGHHRVVIAQGDQDVAVALPQCVVDRSEPAFIDRFITGPHPGAIAQHIAPPSRDPPRILSIDVDLAEAALPRKRGNSRHEGGVIFGDDLVNLWHVNHAVVAGDDQSNVIR